MQRKKQKRSYQGKRYSKASTRIDNLKSEIPSQTSTNHSNGQVWNFVSAPSLHPMKVTLNVNKPGTAPGFIFVAPYVPFGVTIIGQTGALIMDQAGNPVWFRPLDSIYTQNTDFRVQSYKGKPVLTMWQGTISGTQSANPNLPAGDPEPGAYYQIINQNYKVIKKLTAKKGFTSDVHEFTITQQNTALFTAVKQVPANLTPYGGPADGYIDNYSIQEVDLKTGKLLFFWDVLVHVNPADSIVPASSATSSNNIWDCFHVNSVEEGPNDTLLISMRNMWAIYHIDKKTGNIIWQLGGKQSDFTFGPNAAFSWQHDARNPSLNFLYDMRFPNQNLSYRAFKNKWVGLPLYPPSIAVERLGDGAIVYASWNGSTETVAWQVLAGPTRKRLSVKVMSTPRIGFETDISVNTIGPFFQVNALNSFGQVIGTSRIIHVQ